MIEVQLKGRDIYNSAVLKAMRNIDRRLFVPDDMLAHAYEDGPLPIGRGQTISQPYIVAYMAQTLDLKPADTVLEIGSGCGYNAAVMSEMVSHVYTIEIIEWLAGLAKKNLQKAGISNVTVKHGNGNDGWEENAPYDKIALTAATPIIPDAIKEQLKSGGKILAPITNSFQKMILIEKTGPGEFIEHDLIHVRFVPLTARKEEK